MYVQVYVQYTQTRQEPPNPQSLLFQSNKNILNIFLLELEHKTYHSALHIINLIKPSDIDVI